MSGRKDGAFKTRGLLLAAAGALVLSGCSPRSAYTDGFTAYYDGDYRRAMTEFSALARQGDARAESVLLQMCGYRQDASSRYGIPPGRVAEEQWYRDTCEQAALADASPQPRVLYFP